MASGTLEILALELSRALQPLEEQLRAGSIRDLLADLGLQFPPELEAANGFVQSLTVAASSAARLGPLSTQLSTAIENDDVPGLLSASTQFVDVIRALLPALDNIGTQLQSLSGSLPGLNAAEVNAFAADLPGRLFDYVIVTYLEGYHPTLLGFLALVGLLEVTTIPPDPVSPAKTGHTERKLRFDRLGDFLNSPETVFGEIYQWGDPAFDGLALLERLRLLLSSISLPAAFHVAASPPRLQLFLLSIIPRLDLAPRGIEALLEYSIPKGIEINLPIFDPQWLINFKVDVQLDAQAAVRLQPPAALTLIPPSGSAQGDLSLSLVRGPTPGRPAIVLLGVPGGSGLEAQSLSAGITMRVRTDGTEARGEFGFEGQIKGGKLVVSLEGADGFIGEVLSGVAFEADFDLGFGWRAGSGVYFSGSGALEIQLPLHLTLGPVDINALTLTIGIDGNKFPIALAADIKAMLGPLQAIVQQVGVGAELTFPDNKKGNAGPANFALDFKPPTGVGLSLDVGIVRGGGFLGIDPARGEYSGAIELTFAEFLSLKAIGLITTKMPDGSNGFSLLIIITAEFGAGIQLGFGFTLIAVGGLVGLNRTMNLQALMEGIRTGAVESIMFPQNVIANAPKIISDLRTIFPPQEGKFLIGPMAKLGWGTPTLMSVSLGVIIEIPGNIAILGVLKIAIPADDVALIVLQVNFAGALEFDKKRLYFFAALFESRIVFLTIEGEMGLLVAYGGDPNFVVSVGGFHPRFNPPPLPFPSPKRISVSLLSSPISRITIQGYFAVTSNTIQFGARADIFYGLDILNVQGHLAFDALFQFSPFYFIIEISASMSVKVFGAGLFSVGIRGMIEGPNPWHVKGHGSISLLFWDIDVDFETTWGESQNTNLPPINVMNRFKAEVEKASNWRALLPTGNNLRVSLRQMPPDETAMVLHPLGTLHISQMSLPLELKLDKVGNQKPEDVNRLSIKVVGGGLERVRDAFEQFAPAQFQNFSDADKLSRPAFAPEKSGLDLAPTGQDVRSSSMSRRTVRYEEIIIDSNYKRFQRRFRGYLGTLFTFFLNGNSAALCELSMAKKSKLQPFDEKIAVANETYTVALQSTNKAYATDSISFHSEASAREYLNSEIAKDASLAEQIHVIPTFEMTA